MSGIIDRLNRERFEVVILAPRASIEMLKKRLACDAIRFVPFTETLDDASRQIREAACDLIYYWEVGSDALNYFLSCGLRPCNARRMVP